MRAGPKSLKGLDAWEGTKRQDTRHTGEKGAVGRKGTTRGRVLKAVCSNTLPVSSSVVLEVSTRGRVLKAHMDSTYGGARWRVSEVSTRGRVLKASARSRTASMARSFRGLDPW